jgi:hypothetical protein
MKVNVIKDSIGTNGPRITTLNITTSKEHYIRLLGCRELSVTNQINYEYCGMSLIVTSTNWEEVLTRPHSSGWINKQNSIIKEAIEKSSPTELEKDDWHLPFITEEDWDKLSDRVPKSPVDHEILEYNAVKLSGIRCADKHSNRKKPIEEELTNAELLMVGYHWSPFEHQAQMIDTEKHLSLVCEAMDFGKPWENPPIPRGSEYRLNDKGKHSLWSRNFNDVVQARALLEEDTER